MAVIFLSSVTVGFKTLIRLILASCFILAGKLHWIVSTGTATQLYGWKLWTTAVLLFIYGALDDIGIGCFAPTMATIYAMGMNPAAAFPIMMCGSTFSLAVGSVQFIKQHSVSSASSLPQRSLTTSVSVC
ncbi:MAG: Hypothetical protein AJITA_00048 [Acetilactobacillus jinshanensis]